MEENKFVGGMFYKTPSEKAPPFIKANISIKVDEFDQWFADWREKNPQEPWIAIEVVESKRTGKPYCQLDTYKKLGMTEKPSPLEDDSSIPF